MKATEKTPTKKSSGAANEVMRRKLTAAEADLKNPGDEIEGFFLEMKEVEQLNPETAELRLQTKVYMETERGGERFFVWGNAGLKTAIIDSCVTKGDHIVIVKLEKKKLSGGRTKNQYDIFQITGETN